MYGPSTIHDVKLAADHQPERERERLKAKHESDYKNEPQLKLSNTPTQKGKKITVPEKGLHNFSHYLNGQHIVKVCDFRIFMCAKSCQMPKINPVA